MNGCGKIQKGEFIMKRKRLLVLITATVMSITLLGGSVTVKAEENGTEQKLNVEFVDSLEGVEKEALVTVSAEELSHDYEMQQNVSPNFTLTEEDFLGEFQPGQAEGISGYSSANSITQDIPGVIETEGGLSYLLVNLAPGQILQATLAGPNNPDINYDLQLYTYNNGVLETLLAASTLETYMNTYKEQGVTKSVEDSISYINTGDAVQEYALIVYSVAGCSSTETFNLTVSLDEQGYYDASEPNDSPFTAVTVDTGAIVTGCNLNVSNDQDWYVWNVPSTVNGVSLSLDNSDYTVEVYHNVGLSMVLDSPDANGLYSLEAKNYYIRVYNCNSNFTSSDYTLTFVPSGTTAATIKMTFQGDMESEKISYNEGPHYRFKEYLRPSVVVLDASGYPVTLQKIRLTWLSTAWNEETGNDEAHQDADIDMNGKAEFNLETPRALGSCSFTFGTAKRFRHYYDYDGIVLKCGNASYQERIYHFAYSDYLGG